MKSLGKATSIYIINLPSRPDRRTESIALMQTLNLEAFIVPAYSVQSVEIVSQNRYRNKLLLKLTELACWASHMRVWMTIANNTLLHNNTWSFIFEDDIDLEIDTPRILKSFSHSIWNEADLIYLGHCGDIPGTLIDQSWKHIHRVHQALRPSYSNKENTPAELHFTPDKKYLLVSNRGDENIVIYNLNENHDEILSIKEHLNIQGSGPRYFTFDPTGKFLLVANQDSNNLTCFSYSKDKHTFEFISQLANIESPQHLLFIS
ncbi:unnamed protein product [Adineta steineri]|uniref:Uncharacterized protein n=1 Tax=Adineta steineri TaxID=433720 RepID=A0A815G0T6_9BILA|nr:unnamed protein product [Adineta steineri]